MVPTDYRACGNDERSLDALDVADSRTIGGMVGRWGQVFFVELRGKGAEAIFGTRMHRPHDPNVCDHGALKPVGKRIRRQEGWREWIRRRIG